MSAFSAFRSFSQYEETKPYRWRAFFTQGTLDCVRGIWFVLTLPILLFFVAIAAVTWPFWKLHELVTDTSFEWLWLPISPVWAWWRKTYDEIHPIWQKASGQGIVTSRRAITDEETDAQ